MSLSFDKPDDVLLLMKILKSEYADSMIKSGTIKFNCAQTWIDIAESGHIGQGDLYEATFAACEMLDINNMKIFALKHPDVKSRFRKNMILFSAKKTRNTPAYCIYGLKVSSLKGEPKEGFQTLLTTIPRSYILDFLEGKSFEDIKNMHEKDRPVIVIISRADIFKAMLYKYFMKEYSLTSKEIIIKHVEYEDIFSLFHSAIDPPYELFIKDSNRFSHQSETRIVLNSKQPSLDNYLLKNTINLGTLNNIAIKLDLTENMISGLGPDSLLLEVDVSLEKV